MKLRINRKRWLRGGKDGRGREATPLLRDKEGRQCCLGFYARALGYKPAGLIHKRDPKDLEVLHKPDPKSLEWDGLSWLVEDSIYYGWWNTSACTNLMKLNDAPTLDEGERERRIAEKFAEQGIEVEFFG